MIRSEIKEAAEKRGIKTAGELATAADLNIAVAYRVWKGEFERIGIDTLDRLCRTLRVNVCKLLVYEKSDSKG